MEPAAGVLRPRLLLSGILVLALALRLWNADQGLPYYTHPDEPKIFETALRSIDPVRPDLHPLTFTYPSLQMYVTAGAYCAWKVLSPVLGLPRVGPDLEGRVGAVRVARTVSALYSTLSVLLLYLLGASIGSKRAGLLSAASLALAPLPALHPHYANVDSPLVCFGLLAAWMAARHRGRGMGFYFASCAAVGLAASTKYPGALFFALPAFVVLCDLRDARRPLGSTLLLLVAGGTVALAVFLAGSPFVLLDWPAFVEFFTYEARHAADLQPGFDLRGARLLDVPYVYPVVVLQAAGVGAILFAVGIVGLVHLARARGRQVLPLVAWSAYLLGTGWARTSFPRYALPLLPWLLLAGSLWVEAAFARGRRWPRILALAGILYAGLVTVTQIDDLAPPTPVRAFEWLRRNVPPGATLAVGVVHPNLVPLLRRAWVELELDPVWLARAAPDVVVTDSWLERHYLRDPACHVGEIRFLDALHDGSLGYRRAASFEARYFTESLLGLLDPYLRNRFESPDIHVFVR